MRRLSIALVMALAATGCTSTQAHSAQHQGRLAAADRTAQAAPPAPTLRVFTLTQRHALRTAVAAYMRERPLHAGIMVQDLRTGRSFGYREHSEYITASIAKVNILTGLLLERQARHRGLSSWERATATQMIRYSDNNAADQLYAAAGQGDGLERVDRRLGMKNTEPYPTVWGATHTCPADQVRLLHVLTDPRSPLTPAHRRYVLGLMHRVTPEQFWGVSAAARPGEWVGLKNGWVPMHYMGSGWAINSIGRITGPDHDFLVAVMTGGAPSMFLGIQTAEHLATMVVDALR